MEVRINKEIRDYQESMFFGLSLRQCIFSALAVAAAVGAYFALNEKLGFDVGWICILCAAPFAACGFVKYHGLTAEQFVLAWIRSEFLTPEHITSVPENTYADAILPTLSLEQAKRIKLCRKAWKHNKYYYMEAVSATKQAPTTAHSSHHSPNKSRKEAFSSESYGHEHDKNARKNAKAR